MKKVSRDRREVIREEMLRREKILAALREGPRTVPEVAAALGFPAGEVMFWMMGMRKYGHLEETGEPTEEGYYRYQASVKGES
ncbi:MAG: MarR family transcriptional regulator [Armatimonadetes bacterium]|nr:MarR family transcriptional regulator [Armatimonadota bacterium]